MTGMPEATLAREIELAYAAIAWRCWFVVPMTGALAAALFMTVGWLL